MSKKQRFIAYIKDNILAKDPDFFTREKEVAEYWETFSYQTEVEKPRFTNNGAVIMKFLVDNATEDDIWTAKSIAEHTDLAPKTVSGSIRKLVNDGYVVKISEEPVQYKITGKGREVKFED